ncbi:MAG: HAMP domain-containing histidine kinase [Chloroflexi bacterium]|nr:HAMP domain-containing histidine kinase [Chloroflexota bacterium]
MATIRSIIQHWLAAYWQGPPNLAPSVQLEWRLIALRLPAIPLVLLALPLLGLQPGSLHIAYGLLAFALVYVLALRFAVQRRPRLVANGYLPAAVDTLLTLVLTTLTGGISSPVFLVMFTVSVANAMRYGYGPSLLMPAACLAIAAARGLALNADLLPPCFLALVIGVAGCLTEQTHAAERQLRVRARRARQLNEASAALAGHVNRGRDELLQQLPHVVQQLFGAGVTAVAVAAGGLDTAAPIHRADALEAELRWVCATRLHAPGATEGWWLHSCAHGEPAVVVLASAQRRAVAAVAWTLPSVDWLEGDLRDIVVAFADRLRLAIENAELYRNLEARQEALRRAFAQLAETHQELVRMDGMKTNFLANVSHELRTPLTSMLSFSELLLAGEVEPDIQREFVGIMNLESERLTRMVDEVLDITKIESGSMEWNMAVMNVDEMLRQVAKAQQPLIEQRGLHFTIDVAQDLPPTYGDGDRLRQVVTNLLNNALKFTPSGTIALRAYEVSDELVIEVIDSGIGIAPENHARVFDKFQQVGDVPVPPALVPRGTGLGLPICREIVEHHGGRMWLESALGHGSRFVFTLPAHAAPAARVA